jgi:hypothetical protein
MGVLVGIAMVMVSYAPIAVSAAGEEARGAGEAKLSWSAPSSRLDGSALDAVAGYKVYVGRSPGRYERIIEVGTATGYTLTGLEPGAAYYFAVAVYDADGLESPLSNEVRFIVGGEGAGAVAPAVSAAVAAADFVIGTGQREGGYFEIGTRLADLLNEAGWSARAVESAGSLENLELLAEERSAVNVVLSQADAYHLVLQTRSGFGQRVAIASRWGLECVFIVAPRGSSLRTDADLRAPARLGLPDAKSGAAVTFDSMVSLVPELEGVRPVYGESLAAIEALGAEGGVDAVMMVIHPKARPPAMARVVDNFAEYQFVQITDAKLDGKLPDGERVYERKRITPKPISDVPLQDTVCTRRLILANEDKLDTQRLDVLRSLLDRRWRDVFVAD